MADLRRVVPGQDLVIPAATYNEFIDTAKIVKGASNSTSPQGPNVGLTSVLCRIKNSSGSNVERFRSLAIGDPIVLPSVNANEFQNAPICFDTDTPTDTTTGNWCILLDSIPNGQFGRAIFSGITQVWLNLLATDDVYCDTVSGSVVPASGTTGPSEIVWVAGGVGTATTTGPQWAMIRLGGNSRLPLGSEQWQIFQMLTAEEAGWDYSMLSGMLPPL